jgi:cytochrome bd-type quinol oxidase subunit 2
VNIAPWQAPLLVMGGIIVVESGLALLVGRFSKTRLPRWFWNASLSFVFVVAAGLIVIAVLGSTRADQLASVLTGVAALLTFLSYRPRDKPSSAVDTGQMDTGQLDQGQSAGDQAGSDGS